MAELSVFDQLVRTLTDTGRRDLLEKLQSDVSDETEPLKTMKPEDERTVNVEAEMGAIRPFRRLLYFLWSLISGRNLEDMVRERLLRRLRAQLDDAYDGLMYYRSSAFSGCLFDELEELLSGVLVFREPLEQAMGSHRTDFYAFLAGIELGFEDRLGGALPSIRFWDNIELDEDVMPKSDLLRVFEGVFQELPAEEKALVYRDAQSLFYLFKLAHHSIETMLASFHQTAGGQDKECDFGMLVKSLTRLSELLFSLVHSPSAEGLRALFLFHHHEHLENPDFDPEKELRKNLLEAEEALTRIRGFNERVPLTCIIRYITKNLDYHPRGIGGAEDWFVSFKDFWYRRIERAYTELGKRNRKRSFMNEAGAFLGMSEIPQPSFLGAAPFNGDVQSRHNFSLAYLGAFYSRVFKKMMRYLKIILDKGEFYKEQNRSSFAEDFDYLVKMPARLAVLARKFTEDGDLGIRYHAMDAEALDPKEKAERTRELIEEFDRAALGFVDIIYQHLTDIRLIIGGILHGKPGDNFDTLTNLERIGGEENPRLRMLWEKSEQSLGKAGNLLREIRQLEAD